MPLDVDVDCRADTVTAWGGGIGFRVGDTVRIGLNYEDASRDSRRPERNFDRQRGLRIARVRVLA